MIAHASRRDFDAISRTDPLAFAERCFFDLHPGAHLDRNWSHEAFTYELGRILRGEVTRLIINAPPRSLKSMFTSVVFPAYVLGLNPTKTFICASYSQDLANTHANNFRKIVQSPWYKKTFHPLIPLKDTESEYLTVQGGGRLATSVGGTLTGRGADIIVLDDPLSAADAYSKVSRDRLNAWFPGSLMSRLNDKRKGCVIVVMQRLHQDDLSGILSSQGGWGQLILPAVTPIDRRIPLSDQRVFEWRAGEPLDRVREPHSVLDQLQKQMGSSFFNAQYNQSPMPADGNMLKYTWLREYEFLPPLQSGDEIVQSWDTALKVTDASDFSACLTFRVRNKNEYYLIDVFRERVEFPELCRMVISQANHFRANAILIEDKVSGTSLIQTTKRSGLQSVVPMTPSNDKVSRMYGRTPQLEAGSLYLPKSAPWLSRFLEEYLSFPRSRHDDQIDALSQFLQWQADREDSRFEVFWT